LIKIKQIPRKIRTCSCDNCNRVVPFVLVYSFCDSKGKKYDTRAFCEDCANALGNLFHNCMEEGKPFMYDMDEIKEIEEELLNGK